MSTILKKIGQLLHMRQPGQDAMKKMTEMAQMSEMHPMDEIDQMTEMGHMNEMDQMSDMHEMGQRSHDMGTNTGKNEMDQNQSKM